MPVEISQVSILPSDFFTCNPSIDVPGSKNMTSKLADCCQSNGAPVTNGHVNGVNGVNGHA